MIVLSVYYTTFRMICSSHSSTLDPAIEITGFGRRWRSEPPGYDPSDSSGGTIRRVCDKTGECAGTISLVDKYHYTINNLIKVEIGDGLYTFLIDDDQIARIEVVDGRKGWERILPHDLGFPMLNF